MAKIRPLSVPFLFRTSGKVIRTVKLARLGQDTIQNVSKPLFSKIIIFQITVEKKLKLSPIYSPNKNESGNTLQDAVDLYTYLNYCPPELLHFIKDLITTGSPKDIIYYTQSAKNDDIDQIFVMKLITTRTLHTCP